MPFPPTLDDPAEPGGSFGGGGGPTPGELGPFGGGVGRGGGFLPGGAGASGFPGTAGIGAPVSYAPRRRFGTMSTQYQPSAASSQGFLGGSGGLGGFLGGGASQMPAWLSEGTWDFSYGVPGAKDAKYASPWDRAFQEVLQKGGQAGTFNPFGSDAYLERLRGRQMKDAGARKRALLMRARGDGSIDPSTYGSYALQADIEGGRNTSQALSDAELQLGRDSQDWIRQLAQMTYGDRLNYANDWREHWQGNEESHRGKGGAFGRMLGGIVGGAVGAIPGVPGGIGGGFAGGSGGAARMGQPGFNYYVGGRP